MKTNAAYRLKASANGTIVIADSAMHVSDWWKELPKPDKIDYIEEHPNSKYAQQAIKEGEDSGFKGTKGLEVGSQGRKSLADGFRKIKSQVSSEIKRALPMITHGAGAVKALGTGQKLSHEHKEALHEIGHIALKAAATHLTGNIHTGAALSKIGVTAITHAIDHFQEAKAKNPKQDDVDTFVDAVGDGIENAKEAPVPKQHAEPSSPYRKQIAAAVKKAASHAVQVIEKSFSNVKPATEGLTNFARGKPLSEHQKSAMKNLGRYALATTIATLPGGIVAHLAAGAGAVAVGHAFRALKGNKASGREILHSFVESIGEGLEHAAIHHIAGASHAPTTLNDSGLDIGMGATGLHDNPDHEGSHGGGHEGGGHDAILNDLADQGVGVSDAKDAGHGHKKDKKEEH